jgi:hypothetical protein
MTITMQLNEQFCLILSLDRLVMWSLRLPGESGRKRAIYCIHPGNFSTKKNYPPHKNYANARPVVVFEQGPSTNSLPICCCVNRCWGADAQRREVTIPRRSCLPAQLHAQPQENCPPQKNSADARVPEEDGPRRVTLSHPYGMRRLPMPGGGCSTKA